MHTLNPYKKDVECSETPIEAVADLVFVRLSSEEASELVTLEQQCFSLPWTEKEFTGAFGQTCFSVFGLREPSTASESLESGEQTLPELTKKGKLVAYASVYHTPDELEILNIAVCTDRRNRGYGRRLLGLILRIAEKMGIVQAVLEVRVTNTPALRLYASFGFTKAGVRRGYYPDTGEDALVYILALSDHND